jgi:hypothetical protein
VQAAIANGLDRTIYTEDFKTACSIAYLQRFDAGRWVDITGCQMGRPTVTVSIGPAQGVTVTFDPHSFQLTAGRPGRAFGAGTYRVRFTYRVDPAARGEDPLTVLSAGFVVR